MKEGLHNKTIKTPEGKKKVLLLHVHDGGKLQAQVRNIFFEQHPMDKNHQPYLDIGGKKVVYVEVHGEGRHRHLLKPARIGYKNYLVEFYKE